MFMIKLVTNSLLVSITLLQACETNEPQSESARVMEILTSHPWTVQTVTVDGSDKTFMYADMTLSFTNTTYNTSNGGIVWPAADTWTFADDTGKSISRGDGLTIAIEEAVENRLILKLTWANTTLGPGRTSSLSSEHRFTFVK